ncbi:hypothetical protein BS47DRAFT_1393102 [Hydnum rufescens UP504]|uniref:Uncharacterized protein n=1 Tax=Hydnum rufescens UP504 TaxID=1448309 RepID=A0A9P6AXV2_9AGAM|nr:hypothetical protein BS47DRAFT_1393102 [Hydnum rufescens UP504]
MAANLGPPVFLTSLLFQESLNPAPRTQSSGSSMCPPAVPNELLYTVQERALHLGMSCTFPLHMSFGVFGPNGHILRIGLLRGLPIFPASPLTLNRHTFSSNDTQRPYYLRGDSFGRDTDELDATW